MEIKKKNFGNKVRYWNQLNMVSLGFLLTSWFLSYVLSAYSPILTSSDWTTWSFTIWNYKIWVPDYSTDSRYWCDKREHNYQWGDAKEGIWHIDKSGNFPGKSPYLLWPQEMECNSRYYRISNDTELNIKNSTILPGAAWYQTIEMSNSEFDGINLSNFVYENVNVSVYSKNGTYSYVLEANLTDGDSLQLSYGESKQLYVLAVSNSTKPGKLNFSAKLYKNSLSVGAISGIIWGLVGFCVILIILDIWIIKCIKNRNSKHKKGKENKNKSNEDYKELEAKPDLVKGSSIHFSTEDQPSVYSQSHIESEFKDTERQPLLTSDPYLLNKSDNTANSVISDVSKSQQKSKVYIHFKKLK